MITNLVKLEHSKASYFVDFTFYAVFILIASWFLFRSCPTAMRLEVVTSVATGLAAWSLLEYLLHRFLMHGVEPFRTWHLEHHRRPKALIGTPTVYMGTAFLTFVFLPAILITDLWIAMGFTLGVVTGYFGYSWMHHAVHHWHAGWLKQLKRSHAVHHSKPNQNYGVSLPFWDWMFGTRLDVTGK